ncbi:Gfo/Idh/MocA family oxidoreductase [Pelagicoccus sp. SDUM812005]|uniref:Gfo/Idh/MocA family oxidoreductase n=1 Tax=Pelagicoccus sp. SDUM812005 TaxID=3041257 RepID=UPI00280D320C|nr:Gfo/Idh/MocA family oxidoreductase [Pelagicoccus sp. SDUM812005]MDQ8180710.1 Gfo/Idh/MocA family oxidoreductase [Pelagicoccus sp. SDUM812005]
MNIPQPTPINRRRFIATSSAALAASVVGLRAQSANTGKLRVAMVGTGVRGTSMWGKSLLEDYGDALEFVALSDINPGRLAYAKRYMVVDCPTFTNFDEMLATVPMDILIVTTVDSTHHEFIVKGLDKGLTVVTEKPMTTDEDKCQQILEAERRSKGKVIVAMNYRYGHLFTELKKMLVERQIGGLTSIDFHWYLNTYHGASYFRRWHGLREKGGTLLLHKSAHHFDLLNWFIDSEPVEVSAFGGLEHYGSANAFRGDNCRSCPHKKNCKFYWDITESQRNVDLYVSNEKYDGYIRDKCLFRHEIDIFDKMAVQIKYANNVQVSYSLTTYSPFEGFRIAFNGMDGRFETWEGLPWMEQQQEDQAALHAKEMSQSREASLDKYYEIITSMNWGKSEVRKLPHVRSGHWGGDPIMKDQIFRGKKPERDYGQAASLRQGAMSVLIGIAARKSIDEKRIVRIDELTDLKPA